MEEISSTSGPSLTSTASPGSPSVSQSVSMMTILISVFKLFLRSTDSIPGMRSRETKLGTMPWRHSSSLPSFSISCLLSSTCPCYLVSKVPSKDLRNPPQVTPPVSRSTSLVNPSRPQAVSLRQGRRMPWSFSTLVWIISSRIPQLSRRSRSLQTGKQQVIVLT